MTNQHLWFEPVSLLTRCSLNEGLLWVWADRVPVSNIYREKNVFGSLQDWECERLNIPPVPSGMRVAAHHQTEERLRSRKYGYMPKDAQEFHVLKGMEEGEALRQWLPLVTAAMELPATELFLKLRRGEIETLGKLLPPDVEIVDFLEDQNSYSGSDLDDLLDSAIPNDFWTMPGIDWLSNAVTAQEKLLLRCVDVGRNVNEPISGPAHACRRGRVCGRLFAPKRACGRRRPAASETNAGTPSCVCVGGFSR